MADPTVPYKVLAKGYSVSGDTKNGYKATVPYLVAWSDAFTFADQIFGSTSATRVGPILFTLPHRFPAANADMYAASFSIEPSGASGTPVPYNGLAPGEYFTHAIVRVNYEQSSATQKQEDDPNKLQQLDPANPITMCEQSVKSAGKMETRKAGSYVFSSGTPVKGDVGVLVPESKLVLTFPKVPYLPWTLIRPYIGTVNSVAMLDAQKGELLLESMDTKIVFSTDGAQQQVQLEYAWSSLGDWNMVPQADGTLALVHKKGTADTDSNRIYAYKDHRQIFATLNYA